MEQKYKTTLAAIAFIDDNIIRLRNSQGNLKIYQKVNWLHQYFCKKHKEMTEFKS